MSELLLATNNLVCLDIPISLLLNKDVELKHLLLPFTGHLVPVEHSIVHGTLSVAHTLLVGSAFIDLCATVVSVSLTNITSFNSSVIT